MWLEQVDTLFSKSSAERRIGSNPIISTMDIDEGKKILKAFIIAMLVALSVIISIPWICHVFDIYAQFVETFF